MLVLNVYIRKNFMCMIPGYLARKFFVPEFLLISEMLSQNFLISECLCVPEFFVPECLCFLCVPEFIDLRNFVLVSEIFAFGLKNLKKKEKKFSKKIVKK